MDRRDWGARLWVMGVMLLVGAPFLYLLFGTAGVVVMLVALGVSLAFPPRRVVTVVLERRRSPWRPAKVRMIVVSRPDLRRAILKRLAAELPELHRIASYDIEQLLQGTRNGRKYWACDLRWHHREKGPMAVVFVAVRLAANLARISIRPEHAVDDLAAAFGYDDIDFENAEFSRRFHVRATDRRKAYAFLSPLILECLLKHDTLQLNVHGCWLLLEDVRGNFQRLLPKAVDFIDLVPRNLAELVRDRPPPLQ